MQEPRQTENLTVKCCFNHQQREAVARCPECHRFFCRECITEHDDKVICASCLQKRISSETTQRRSIMPVLINSMQAVFAFMLLWMVFYYLGRILLRIPTAYHEGTLW